MGVGFRTDVSGALQNIAHKASRGGINPKKLTFAGLIALLIVFVVFGIARANSNQTPSGGANLQLDVSSAAMPQAADQTHTSTPAAPVKQHNSESAELKTDGNAHANTQLKVNNQEISVPNNGSVHKTIKTDGGNVNVQIESRSNNSTKNSSRSIESSTEINIDSSSSKSGGTSVEQEQSMD